MRTSAAIALFAAGAIAAPSLHHAHKHAHQHREAEAQEDVVVATATAFTTVMAGAAPTQAPPQGQTVTVTVGAQQPAFTAHQQQWAPPKPAAPASSAAAPAPAAPAPSSSSSGSSGSLSSFQQQVLDAHNLARSQHGVGNLTYDTNLETAAAALAQQCAWDNPNASTHPSPHVTNIDLDINPGGYGQNAAASSGSENIYDVIYNQWYAGEQPSYANYYGQEPPSSIFENTGHFTQVVWKATTKVGCAIQQCPQGLVGGAGMDSIAFCNYASPGNYGGEYAANVLAPTS